VRIEILGDHPQTLTGLLINISGKGARLELFEPLPINCMVRIDSYAAIYLGEVCYCFEESGAWQIGVQMEHSIPIERGLKNLADRLHREVMTYDSQQQES